MAMLHTPDVPDRVVSPVRYRSLPTTSNPALASRSGWSSAGLSGTPGLRSDAAHRLDADAAPSRIGLRIACRAAGVFAVAGAAGGDRGPRPVARVAREPKRPAGHVNPRFEAAPISVVTGSIPPAMHDSHITLEGT